MLRQATTQVQKNHLEEAAKKKDQVSIEAVRRKFLIFQELKKSGNMAFPNDMRFLVLMYA